MIEEDKYDFVSTKCFLFQCSAPANSSWEKSDKVNKICVEEKTCCLQSYFKLVCKAEVVVAVFTEHSFLEEIASQKVGQSTHSYVYPTCY